MKDWGTTVEVGKKKFYCFEPSSTNESEKERKKVFLSKPEK
jgi:hypothetical protein